MRGSTRRTTRGLAAFAALLLALVALPAAALAADAPWTAQKSGTTQTLYGVSFTSATAGWAVGVGGTVLRTTDGGATWKAQNSKTTSTLYAVRFIDAQHGWAVGSRGTIVRTSDGGATWAIQSSGTPQTLYAITFSGTTTGWAVGGRSTVLQTTDGGSTWKVLTTNGKETYYGVAAADASTLWVVGSKGTVRKSTNGGSAWTTQAANTRSTLNAVACTGPTSAWIAGNGGIVRSTTDGTTWTSRNPGTSQTLEAIVADGDGRVRVAGSSGVVRVTANDGSTWAGEATGTTQALRGAAWSGRHGWLVGSGGTILTYHPDTAPPATTATGLQADDHSGWTNAAVAVSLSATDSGNAGVAATYYTVDGGGQQTYNASFSVSGQGQHVVAYWSVDAVGNAEAAKTGYVNIDTTAPTVAADADTAWHTIDVTVRLSAADSGGSGVSATQYRPAGSADWTLADGGEFVVPATSTQGPHTYDIRSVDAAGNASATGSCTVKIDATAPTTTPTGLGADDLSDWSSTARTVTLAADDGAGSGVKSIHYTLDGGAPQAYSQAFVVSDAGRHPVTYWSEDNVGNVEAIHTGWVNISDPYAQSLNLAADMDSHWHNGAVTVTIRGTSLAPGDVTVHYSIDGVPQPDALNQCVFEISGAGNHEIEFWASYGTQESPRQIGYVNIDMTAPETSTQAGAPGGWVNHTVRLVFLPSDDASGVTATYSAVDGNDQQAGDTRELPAPADHSGDGVHVVTYWSADAAGNVETPKPVTVRIDTRKPGTRAPYAAAVVRGGTAKLRFVVSDKAPCAGTAAAKIVVKNAHGRVVKTVKIARVKTGLTATAKFRCKLAKGKYRFFVYAVDAAGNAQSKVASNRLTVR